MGFNFSPLEYYFFDFVIYKSHLSFRAGIAFILLFESFSSIFLINSYALGLASLIPLSLWSPVSIILSMMPTYLMSVAFWLPSSSIWMPLILFAISMSRSLTLIFKFSSIVESTSKTSALRDKFGPYVMFLQCRYTRVERSYLVISAAIVSFRSSCNEGNS